MKIDKVFNGNINHKLQKIVENDVECLKKSFDNSNEQQLKLKREIYFYKYCEIVGINKVPKLLNFNNNSITIEFINGNNLKSLDLKSLSYFTSFIIDLNSSNYKNTVKYNFCGVESVLSKNNLFENLIKRSLNLSETKRYHPRDLMKVIKNHLDLFFSEQINVGHIIVSPSDFGLHNFILNGELPYFFDFEYSGTDSILKCILDFVLHPANKIEFEDVDLYIKKFKCHLNLNDFIISTFTVNIFCIWWIMRLLNSISSKSIDFRMAKGLILLEEKDEFIENRISNIQKFYNYIK